MVSRRLTLCVVAIAAWSGCTSRDAHDALARRVEATIAPLVSTHQLSGAIVLSREGRVVYERGIGMANVAADAAFTPDTASDGASLAKTFTAAALWLLVVEGRVSLDARVVTYLPEFPHADTTVRHLISHSNGLPPDYAFFDPHFTPGTVRTTRALLEVVAREAPAPSFTPGTRFEYSNLGFDVTALIVESVSGQDYETFLRERFFGPLGMTATFARPARLAAWTGVRTLGYRWRDNAWSTVDVFDMEAFLGASNLYFSARDLARWANAHALGTAVPPDVARVGGARPVIDGHASAINGLSWYCDASDMRCYYTGMLNAFHSLVYWDREHRESVVLVTNSSVPPWTVVTLQRDLVGALERTRNAEAAPRNSNGEGPPPTEPGAADRSGQFVSIGDDRRVVSGVYGREGGDRVSIVVAPAGLTMRVNCGLEYTVFQIERGILFVPGTDEFMAFTGDTNTATTLHRRSMFYDQSLPRVVDDGMPECQ